jgi:hypothetical protein
MIIVDLYRYEENGQVTITPNKHNETDTPSRKRLIAEGENAFLTNGEIETPAVDVMLNEVELWSEVNGADTATVEDYQNALTQLGVDVDA